ncbi:MFS general substrate transporter [Aaosphaeria arxii CBS 175.79]|uniref:MFS general substrate transporter n=1 Tax=Aaosphaeria arxii CBS 175.79 TaxID=1450172 RepID=A0A6A5XSC3_9PLEO|nr:MFS general substrate transporter [Aaosphaeria arxii CBS 175.79]KAF2015809.1 MFS general substrate transporter [Aaosphaeria arxii CBS 175.79]
MSLYEPSVRSSSWSISQRFSRPLTTLEGWREITSGVYAMNSDVRMIAKADRFDPEQYRNNGSNGQPSLEHQQNNEAIIPIIPDIPKAYSIKSFAPTEVQPQTAAPVPVLSPESPHVIEIGQRKTQPKRVDYSKTSQQKYHVFSFRTKWLIVGIVTVIVTSYLAFHGIAGILWSPLADHIGRRPVLLISTVLFISASIPLITTPTFPVLIALRGLQAASIASVIPIGSAVIKDISRDPDRETFLVFYKSAQSVALVLSPLLSGTFSHLIKCRAIFIFLLSIAVAMFAVTALFLPETLRSIAGNGSAKVGAVHKPIVRRPAHARKSSNASLPVIPENPSTLTVRTFMEPFILLREKDVAINVLSGAIIFMMWMMVTVSTTGLFKTIFNLNDLQVGLAYIPNALGVVTGSTLMEKVLKRDILFAFSKFKAENMLPPKAKLCMKELPAEFPLEHTRLRRLPWIAVCFTFTLCAYGFSLAYRRATVLKGWIAIPLFMQFVIAATAHARCTVHQTLVTDLWHQNEHAGIVANNLVRLLLSAAGVVLVQTLLDALRAWSTFLSLGLAVMAVVPLPLIQWYWGREWRAEREVKREIIERFTKV